MLLIERYGGFGSAVAEVFERRAFPGVGLAVVLGQFDGEPALDEAAKRASRLERGQLAVVADEHELARTAAVASTSWASCRVGSIPASSTTSTNARATRSTRGLQIAEQRGDARARDPSILLEPPRRAARDGHAEDGQAGRLPRLARGGERERLAGPRLADHHADAITVQPQALDHRSLLPRQGQPRGHRGQPGCRLDASPAVAATYGGRRPLEVRDRVARRPVMRITDRATNVPVAQREDDAHALRR